MNVKSPQFSVLKILLYLFQYPINLEIKKIFFDLCNENSGEYIGRIKIKINEDMKSHTSMRNFLSLIQGSHVRSYKGIIFNDKNYSNGGLVTPVFLPSMHERRLVDEWVANIGDVFQRFPHFNDSRYSVFVITSYKLLVPFPKLGSVVSDLHIFEYLRSNKSKLSIFDCGILID